jgi:hypothetical protein
MPWDRQPLRGGQGGLARGAGNRALLLGETLEQIGGPPGAVQPARVLADGHRPLPERWLVAEPLHPVTGAVASDPPAAVSAGPGLI